MWEEEGEEGTRQSGSRQSPSSRRKKMKDWGGRKGWGGGGELKEALLPQPPAVLSLSRSVSLSLTLSRNLFNAAHLSVCLSAVRLQYVSYWTKVGFQGRQRNENVWIVIGAPSLKLSIGIKHHTISLSVQWGPRVVQRYILASDITN